MTLLLPPIYLKNAEAEVLAELGCDNALHDTRQRVRQVKQLQPRRGFKTLGAILTGTGYFYWQTSISLSVCFHGFIGFIWAYYIDATGLSFHLKISHGWAIYYMCQHRSCLWRCCRSQRLIYRCASHYIFSTSSSLHVLINPVKYLLGLTCEFGVITRFSPAHSCR